MKRTMDTTANAGWIRAFYLDRNDEGALYRPQLFDERTSRGAFIAGYERCVRAKRNGLIG